MRPGVHCACSAQAGVCGVYIPGVCSIHVHDTPGVCGVHSVPGV